MLIFVLCMGYLIASAFLSYFCLKFYGGSVGGGFLLREEQSAPEAPVARKAMWAK